MRLLGQGRINKHISKGIGMKPYLLLLPIFLISPKVLSDASIFGYWLTDSSIVKVDNCDGYICGTIEHIFVEEGVDPKKLLDDQNKDRSLRSRPLIGITFLYNFLIEDSHQKVFKGGKIYDPRRGSTYKSNIYLRDDGILRVEGCLAFICDGEDWRPLDVIINADGTKDAVLRDGH